LRQVAVATAGSHCFVSCTLIFYRKMLLFFGKNVVLTDDRVVCTAAQ